MPGMVEGDFDGPQFKKLFVDLKEMEGGKPLATALRKNLKTVAEPIKAEIQARAAAFSTRIPGAVGVMVRTTGKNPAVLISVSRKKAPHARPIEHMGQPGTFAHPVFGHDVLVEQQAHPFFFIEATKALPEVQKAMTDAINDAAHEAGFKGD